MLAGKFDRRVTIQRAEMVQVPDGEEVPGWVDLATVWAEKSYRRANEAAEANETAAIRVLRFAIRWSPTVRDVNPKDQLVFEGRAFNIIECNEIGRREGIEIFAEARAD